MLDDRTLATMGNGMVNKALEVSNGLLIALIDALSDVCKDAQGKGVLGDFRKHVSNGHTLNCNLLDAKRVDEFEKVAQNMNLEYLIIPLKGKPEVSTVVYKDSDVTTMNLVVQEMTKEGVPLVEDMEMDIETFCNYVGRGGLDESIGIGDMDSLIYFRAQANQIKLPFAVKEEQGRYVILTATKDFEILQRVPGYTGMITTHNVDEQNKLDALTQKGAGLGK